MPVATTSKPRAKKPYEKPQTVTKPSAKSASNRFKQFQADVEESDAAAIANEITTYRSEIQDLQAKKSHYTKLAKKLDKKSDTTPEETIEKLFSKLAEINKGIERRQLSIRPLLPPQPQEGEDEFNGILAGEISSGE